MSDQLKAHIRTIWPAILAALATLLIDAIAPLGIQLDSALAVLLVGTVLTFAVYSAGNWLEDRTWAPAAWLGRFLLSLGADLGKPSYPAKDPEPDEAVEFLRGRP